MLSQLRPALVILAVMTLITGVLYPLAVTGLAQVLFPAQANGSLILSGGQAVGSELIGQSFDGPEYFWGRLSATGTFAYNAFNADNLTGSSGSNYGPLNPALLAMVQARLDALRAADPGNPAPIRTSARRRRSTRRRAWRAHAASRRPVCARWWTSTPKAGSFGFWASRASTCSSSIGR